MQKFRISVQRHGFRGKFNVEADLYFVLASGFVQGAHAFYYIFGVYTLQQRLGHLAEIAEAGDDGFQVRYFHGEGLRTFAKDLVELSGGQFARSHQIFDGQLQRKERVLELMGKPPRKLAPRGHTLALHQTVALRGQLRGHVVEAARQHIDLIAAADSLAFWHGCFPVAGGDLFGGARQLLDGP